MIDVQATTEGFPTIAINKVGVRNIELPITLFRDRGTKPYQTTALVSSYCDLVEDIKGINMSRIPRTIFEVFSKQIRPITYTSEEAAHALQRAHDTDHIYIKTKFKFPYYQKSPSTELDSPEIVDVETETTLNEGVLKTFITVDMAGMSLCPCSKEMSLLKNNLTAEETELMEYVRQTLPTLYDKVSKAGFGAHNQKSFVKLTVEVDGYIDIECLIEAINQSVSSRTYSILKRPDEKYVTEVSYMGAYINEDGCMIDVEGTGPKFVEDIARQLADNLNKNYLDQSIKDYVIVVRNEESIHSSGIEACAVLSAGRGLK